MPDPKQTNNAEVPMTHTRLRVFAATALLSVAVAVLGNVGGDKTLLEIAGHRQWSRLTAKPIVVESSFAGGG